MVSKLFRSLKYATTVCKHKLYMAVGAVKVGGVSFRAVLFHDLSKFSLSEFGPYRDKFVPTEELNSSVDWHFKLAWEHHYGNNRHHWQYWWYGDQDMISPMPEQYVREMVADWIAAGMAYETDKPFLKRMDILPWVSNNLPKMKLHDTTKSLVIRILLEMGYSYKDLFDAMQDHLHNP